MKLRPGASDQCTRLAFAAWRLARGQVVTSRWIRERFGVCRATAKRDMLTLEQILPVRATGEWPHPRTLRRA